MRLHKRLRPELCEPTDRTAWTRELLVAAKLRIRFPHRLEPPVPREVEMVVGVFERNGKRTLLKRPMQRLIADGPRPARTFLGILDSIQQRVKFLRRLADVKRKKVYVEDFAHLPTYNDTPFFVATSATRSKNSPIITPMPFLCCFLLFYAKALTRQSS